MKRIGLVLLTLLLAACHQERLSYDGHAFRVRKLPAAAPQGGWTTAFKVYVSADPDAPPMLGAYEVHGHTLVFTPAYPPSETLTLRAVFAPPGGGIESLTIPGKAADKTAPTNVVEVYPTTAEWPANQLKFYIYFSQAMTKGAAWSHIHLIDEEGMPISKPFVEIDQELWDPAVKRLTVLFDPGLIKRGLTDNMDKGPPLKPGHRYTLRIDADWPDANGKPLIAAYEKAIVATGDVRLPVDPRLWKVTPPSNANAPLVIDFPRPMDHALAQRVITVPGVEGSPMLMANEQRWTYRPKAPWKPGRHEIRIEGILEDLAGNRLERLFDVDVTDPAQNHPSPKVESLFFETR